MNLMQHPAMLVLMYQAFAYIIIVLTFAYA